MIKLFDSDFIIPQLHQGFVQKRGLLYISGFMMIKRFSGTGTTCSAVTMVTRNNIRKHLVCKFAVNSISSLYEFPVFSMTFAHTKDKVTSLKIMDMW